MDWLKKKKDEAKKAASQATAKMTNKRTAFRGEGNVLGGGEAAAPAPAAAAAPNASSGLKMPSFGVTKQPEVSEEELKRRRELQQKALDQRGNAWEKRVSNARKARLQQEGEQSAHFPLVASASPAPSGPPPAVLSNEEVKARELQNAHDQMGFNPYAATFSSSNQATSAMNSIAGGSSAPLGSASSGSVGMPPPAPVASPQGPMAEAEPAESGAVYVLLRQDPPQAITAAQTLIKMLSNVVKSPEEEKFRKVRLSNAAIQSKLVAVCGALDLLEEAGFSRCELDGDSYLMLARDAFQAERVQSAIDRTEVALIQLQHDSSTA